MVFPFDDSMGMKWMKRSGKMKLEEIVSRDPEIMSGTLVFTGTRVPAQSLVDYLKAGDSLEDFLDGFPSVRRAQAEAFLELALQSVVAEIDHARAA
jgi:uncharacterized protein (DUF433 family)